MYGHSAQAANADTPMVDVNDMLKLSSSDFTCSARMWPSNRMLCACDAEPSRVAAVVRADVPDGERPLKALEHRTEHLVAVGAGAIALLHGGPAHPALLIAHRRTPIA